MGIHLSLLGVLSGTHSPMETTVMSAWSSLKQRETESGTADVEGHPHVVIG